MIFRTVSVRRSRWVSERNVNVPELPEVHAIVNNIRYGLGNAIWGIDDVAVLRGDYLPGKELEQVRINAIKSVSRRGKFVIFQLNHGWMIGHNAMSGFWDFADWPWTFDYVEGKRISSESDVRVTLRITPYGPDRGSDRILRFHDARLFGSLRFYDKIEDAKCLKNLGPDAIWTDTALDNGREMLYDDFCRIWFQLSKKKSKMTVKEVLMDQSFMAGIGNIYASEILHNAFVRPDRPFIDLNYIELRGIDQGARWILTEMVKSNIDYSLLKVYRKEKCITCAMEISKIKIKGRSSYSCPRCQI